MRIKIFGKTSKCSSIYIYICFFRLGEVLGLGLVLGFRVMNINDAVMTRSLSRFFKKFQNSQDKLLYVTVSDNVDIVYK